MAGSDFPGTLALMVGLALSLVLYGILIGQTVSYCRSKSRDNVWMKLIVSAVVLLETAMVIFDVVKAYLSVVEFDILGFIVPPGQDTRTQEMLSGNTVMMSLVSTTVQLFFAWRVSALSSHRVLPGFIALCSVCSLTLALALCIMNVPRGAISELDPATVQFIFSHDNITRTQSAFPLILAWLLICAAVDIILSIYLTCYLWRRRTGFQSSDLLIRKIVRFTVETGLITSVCAILDAILHVTANRTVPLLIPDLMLSKLYANSFLASLNARSRWADACMDGGLYQDWNETDIVE